MLEKFWIPTIIYLLFSIPSSVKDIRSFRIPLYYVFAGIAALIGYHIYILIHFNLSYQYFLRVPFAALVSSIIIFFCTRVLSGGGLGKGDIIFGALSALYCGFYQNIIGIVFASLIGVLYFLLTAVLQRFKKNKNIHRPVFAIPFVPFITAGALLSKILQNLQI